MVERELIAERTIYAVDKDSRGFEIRLMLGKPYQVESEYEIWACPVALQGLHRPFPDMHGIDSWQALMLAKTAIRRFLEYFIEDGGRLFFEENGNEISPAELFDETPPEIPEAIGSLSDEQQARVDQLTSEELNLIDDSLMADASVHWRKSARVVGTAMAMNRDTIPNVPDIFYAQRSQKLVEKGLLSAQGNLNYMRFSEVKLPD
ncbi:MAG: hypothetical protein JNL64_12560 [Blastocatellia bacterium]|nr:hypothetical protein [Blastocatellia bacterium]